MSDSQNDQKFRIGIVAVVILVLLRVTVGLHFFYQGVDHYNDPDWSAAGFFRQAKGPLAGLFEAWVPDTSGGWDQSIAVVPKGIPGSEERKNQDEAASEAWRTAVLENWNKYQIQAAEFYNFSEEQNTAAKNMNILYQQKFDSYLEEQDEDIQHYRNDIYRIEQLQNLPSSDDVPHQKKWIAHLKSFTSGQRRLHLDWLSNTQKEYHEELLALRTDGQLEKGDMPQPAADIETLNMLVVWFLMAVGALITLGLFTRVASLFGALFLLSVVLSQLPWIANTLPVYSQFLEMIAMLVLVVAPVGRWCGLDSFVCKCCCRTAEEKTS